MAVVKYLSACTNSIELSRLEGTMTDDIEALRVQLREKDGIISMMKDKTRAFVTKMKDEHEAALRGKQVELQNLQEQNDMIVQKIKDLEKTSDATSSGKLELEAKLTSSMTKISSMKEQIERINEEKGSE